MAVANHIIQRQLFEVEMENPADAFQFRNRLGEVFHERILPGMEALFDELGTGKTIRVDKLELDLDNINKANWEEELQEKAIAKMKELLQLQRPLWQDTDPADSVTFQESKPDFTTSFISFLSTGRLPWHSTSNTNFEKELKEQLTDELITALKQFLASANDTALTRLVYQLSNDLLLELMTKLSPEDQKNFMADFKKAGAYISIALRSLQVPESNSRKMLFVPFFSWFSSSRQENLEAYYASAFAAITQPAYPEIAKYFQLAAAPANYKSNNLLRQIEKELDNVSIKRQLVDEPLHPTRTQPENDQEIFIENAGLVMLHPFLAPLFTHLNILKKGKFINELAQMKAVLLSQYLVDGSTETEEHRLVLNKLLCGMPLDKPIIKKLDLSQAEKAEADDLLSQVTKLWTKNNTPVNATTEGLQQSFLHRNGKLQQQDKNWRLQVEQKAFDMLLSSLPWGISIIKNSWMDGMIWVEWG